MDPQPAVTFQDLFSFVIGDMVKAITGRDGETREQQMARSRAAVHTILGFQPRDVIEAMLAGHCVMLHEVMTADVLATLRGDADAARPRPRSNVVGLNKAFNDTLNRLERYRRRPAEGSRDSTEAQSLATSDPASPPSAETSEPHRSGPMAPEPNRAARRQAARAERRTAAMQSRPAGKPTLVTSAQPAQEPQSPGRTAVYASTPQAIAASKKQAMAALQSGAPACAMDSGHPCDGLLAAAASKGSPHSSGPWAIGATACAASG
jgi:hypothetical protein